MDAKKTGKSIAFLRKQYGLTQKELAERLGVTDKAVSKWERGMGGPDISLLTKLAIALDVDIESLLEGNLTHLGLKYKGLLVLDYPEDISADSILYDKPVVFLQLSLFLLSGIREIAIWGNKRNLEFLKNEIADGGSLGVNIVYTQIENTVRTFNSMQNIQYINRMLDGSGLFVVSGLDFIYGKDLTKTLRRLFYDSRETITLVSPGGKNLSVSIYPSGVRRGEKGTKLFLERGMIAFPVTSKKELSDASFLMRIIEEHMGEQIADLKEIAIIRGLTV